MNEINQDLDEEYVMRWMGIILRDTTQMDGETLAQAFEQLVAHLRSHIETARKMNDR